MVKKYIERAIMQIGKISLHTTKAEQKITRNNNINVNFLPQDAGWFYANMSGTNRAKLLGTICGTHYADSAVSNYNKKQERKSQTTALVFLLYIEYKIKN